VDYIVNLNNKRHAKKKVFIKNTIFLDVTNCENGKYTFNFTIPVIENNEGLQYAYTHIGYLLHFWDKADIESDCDEIYKQLYHEYNERLKFKINNIRLQFIKNLKNNITNS